MYNKLTLVDDSTIKDHHYLSSSDTCGFFGEYTARKGFAYSETNQLILNLKISVEHKNSDRYEYKRTAIETVARCLLNTITIPEEVTFIPVPPSKDKNDPLYDDRIIQI